MKIEKLPSGSYRATKMYKGKRYRVTFDHLPNDKEVLLALADKMQEDSHGNNGSFESYAWKYINNRDKVLSPASRRTYETKIKQLSNKFKNMNLYDITREDVQVEVSYLSGKYEPKTVKTAHGFISSVLRSYRPNLILRTKLPQSIQKDEYIPTKRDVMKILEMAKPTRYYVPFQLATMYGCRRGELCAMSIEDLKGNELWIHRDVSYHNGDWIVKENPKTDASNRKIVLPDELVQLIHEQGYIYEGHPNALIKALHRYQKKLGIPEFDFHSFRKFFCSYAHEIGISEADTMAIGGWATPSIMKTVYRKSMETSKKKSMRKITKKIMK